MRVRPFDTGVVTISLDTELGWARVNTGEYDDVAGRLDEGRMGIRRLLSAFDEYGVPATWAVVGRLVDPAKPSAGLEALPTVADDLPWDRDWWRMPSLVSEIRAAEVDHEVASHSGSHLLYDRLSSAQAREDLAYFRETVGGPSTGASFVFPQNRTGNVDALRDHGFGCYRGLSSVTGGTPTPIPVLPRRTDGLVNVPLSAGYRHFENRHPLLRSAPVGAKVATLRVGTRLAARTGRVFHVALHPKDFALADGEALLSGFERWLASVAAMERRGTLTVLPMGEVARRAEW